MAPTSANTDGNGNGIEFGNSAVDGISGGSETWTLASARACAVRTLERIACRFARPGTEAELPLPLRVSEDGDCNDQVGGCDEGRRGRLFL